MLLVTFRPVGLASALASDRVFSGFVDCRKAPPAAICLLQEAIGGQTASASLICKGEQS